MKIAYITTSYKEIGKDSMGGIESFSLYLLNDLKKLGHDITIFGPGEIDKSLFPGISIRPTYSIVKDIEVNERFLKNRRFGRQALNYSVFQYSSFAKACEIAEKENFDILHFSAPAWYVPFISQYKGKIPVIVTVHGHYLKRQVKEYIFGNFKGPHLVNISEYVEKRFDAYKKKITIPNGIDVSRFKYNDAPSDDYAFLGRITGLKSVEDAIWATKKNKENLKIGGDMGDSHYFDDKIEKMLDEKRRYIGPVSLDNKSDFLGSAKAILLPSYPFGFVPLEAMACGTPVIAYRKNCDIGGVIEDGVNGYLVETKEEMAEKMNEIHKIKRSNCREYVEKFFSSSKMAKRYTELYKSL